MDVNSPELLESKRFLRLLEPAPTFIRANAFQSRSISVTRLSRQNLRGRVDGLIVMAPQIGPHVKDESVCEVWEVQQRKAPCRVTWPDSLPYSGPDREIADW